MQLGVVDDIALLAETDLKDKEGIAKRKSLYSQLQGQISGAQGTIKDQAGTIETLERQVVQAGIKMKIMAGQMEIFKKKEEAKGQIQREVNEMQDASTAEKKRIIASSNQMLAKLKDESARAGRNLGQSVADADHRMQEAAEAEGKQLAEEKNKSVGSKEKSE